MVGVFDSGMGGLFALSELRRLSPKTDIAFLKDSKNAPYGTKSEEQILSFTSSAIEKLLAFGAERVLMACCTASTVYKMLPENLRSVSVPIISPTAKKAVLLTENQKIGILSTEATKKSMCFPKEIEKLDKRIFVLSASSLKLVLMAESGKKDGNLTKEDKEIIAKELLPFKNTDIDTLILGCTHFAYFEKEIENALGVKVVNSALVAAECMIEKTKNEGEGRVFFL